MNIFYNSLGDFQWASVAAIVAAIGACVSFMFSLLSYLNSRKSLKHQINIDQKKIDADLKAKARIDWIKIVRNETSELLSLSGRRANYIGILENLYKKDTYSDRELDEIKKSNEDIVDINNNITTHLFKLKLLFGPENGEILEDHYGLIIRHGWTELELFTIGTNSYQNDSNMKELIDNLRVTETNSGKNEIIVGLINIIILSLTHNPEMFEKQVKKAEKEKVTVGIHMHQTYLLIKSLGNIMRLYIKIEWDLAKEGK